MESQPAGGSPPESQAPRRPRLSTPVGFLLALALLIALLYFASGGQRGTTISYDFFRQQLQAGNIAEIEQNGQIVRGKFKKAPLAPAPDAKPSSAATSPATGTGENGEKPSAENSTTTKSSTAKSAEKRLPLEFTVTLTPAGMVSEQLDAQFLKQGVKVKSNEPSDSAGLMLMLSMGMTILLFVGLWFMFRRARDQFMGAGGILSGFSKSPAKRYETGKRPTTFADVAGLENVKKDLEEVVEFLKNPEKFQRLGGRIPKGVLLMGPPGTGKTLLAKAVAGEAGVPFFSINGSEFIQMFVGVGAGRVRDMFKTAKEAAPCILFIDEIDAVGRVRGAGLGGGHDEREQTLNQILSEMDGFSPNESVIVLAATNRPDVLDPALLRPGRFDRHVTVDRPNLKARVAIFKVHTHDIPVADDVDLQRLAAGTVGLTGADIRNLVNEAALWATRLGKDKVDSSDFEQARDKVLMGPAREEVLSPKERIMTAYHEAGHALLAWILPGVDRVHKVTIIPRGRALGVTQLLPEEDRLNIGERDLYSRLTFMLGGRAAEKLIFDEYSAGAEDDLKRATQLARRMVTHWGMSERLGPVAYRTSEEHPFLGREITEQREFSDHTARIIDEEVARILHEVADRAKTLLTEQRELLDRLANRLEEQELLDDQEIEAILGPSANRLAESNGQASIKDGVRPA